MAKRKKTAFLCPNCKTSHDTEKDSLGCCDFDSIDDTDFQEEDNKTLEQDNFNEHDDFKDNELGSSLGRGNGESDLTQPEKPTMDAIFDFTKALSDFEHQLNGDTFNHLTKKWVYSPNGEIGPADFIKEAMSLLVSVVKETFFWSYKEPAAIEEIMDIVNSAFIDLAADELLIPDTKLNYLCSCVYSILTLFMGLVERGHGSQTLKEIYAGIASESRFQTTQKGTNLVQGIKDTLAVKFND